MKDFIKADNTYDEIQDEYVSSNKEQSIPDQTTDDKSEQPKVSEVDITIDFDALLNRNKDVIGWLYCPDTDVNYPVVQGRILIYDLPPSDEGGGFCGAKDGGRE